MPILVAIYRPGIIEGTVKNAGRFVRDFDLQVGVSAQVKVTAGIAIAADHIPQHI